MTHSPLVLVLTLFFLYVNGFWATGHMLVAQIGWEKMDSELRAKISYILDSADYYDITPDFVTSACWPDDEKARNVHLYDTWHYIDYPFINSSNPSSLTVEEIDPKNNIEYTLFKLETALKSTKVSYQGKADLIRFYTHFVGDIHQPLHAVTLYSDKFPTGDLGGNKFKIKGVGVSNLHSYWDSAAEQVDNSITRPLSSSSQDYLSNLSQQWIADSVLPDPPASWASLNYTSWGLNSYNLAIKYAYNTTPNGYLSDYYQQVAKNILKDQITLAGFRLWYFFDSIRDDLPDVPNVDTEDASTLPVKPTNNTLQDLFLFLSGMFMTIVLGALIVFGIRRFRRKNTSYHDLDTSYHHDN